MLKFSWTLLKSLKEQQVYYEFYMVVENDIFWWEAKSCSGVVKKKKQITSHFDATKQKTSHVNCSLVEKINW